MKISCNLLQSFIVYILQTINKGLAFWKTKQKILRIKKTRKEAYRDFFAKIFGIKTTHT